MLTTRRSDTSSISALASEASKGGVALLERKEPVSYKEYVAPEAPVESAEEARARMQENLAKLLNYDRYAEQVQDVSATATVDAIEVMEAQASTVENIFDSSSEEDIRPTSTTMQFSDGDVENLRMDMRKEEEVTGSKYKLNAKGKLVIVLYSLVLTLVMALIVINTGVLAKLSSTEQSLNDKLNETASAYSSLETEIKDWSAEENIINIAQNEYGMIKNA